MKRKSNLDERQERKLLEIESHGCWLAFWGLLAVMIVQIIVYGFGSKQIAGEWIVFMILTLYILLECLKNGIWDRRLKPDRKTNLVISLLASMVFGVMMFASVFHRFPDKPVGAAASGVFSAASVFVLCFILVNIFSEVYKKKQKELEKEPEDSKE